MIKRPKILYIITQSEWGGAQRYVFDLATNLAGDFEVVVGCGGGGPLIKKLREKEITVHVLTHLVREIRPATDLKALGEIKKIIKQEQPDIVHTNSSKAEIVGNLAAELCGVPVVFTAHGFVFLGYNGSYGALKAWCYVWLERIANIKTKKIICVSEYDRQGGLENRIIHPRKMVTVHNGIQLDGVVQAFSNRESLGNQKMIIGVIANLYKKKGVEYLVRAMVRLNQQYPYLECRIVGDGQERDALEGMIKALSLDNVKLLGFQSDANRYLDQFDIFVLPSLKEGFPYVILEAMAAGLPIVATRIAGIPEAVQDGEGGFIVPPADEKALAEKIGILVNDIEMRRRMGENNRKRVQAEFSLETMVQKTRRVYEEVLFVSPPSLKLRKDK